MKNVKLGIFALLGLVGATSAFTNAPKHFTGTTYYAVTNGAGSYTWQLTKGSFPNCNSLTASPACTIVTNGVDPSTTAGAPAPTGATLINPGLAHRHN